MTLPNALVHQALVYDSTDRFLASAVPFIAAGLSRGDAVLAVTTDANADLLRDRFDGEGKVAFLPASEWFDAPGRTLASYHRRLDEFTGANEFLRVLSEPVWTGRDPLETAEWGRYESVVNVALAAAPAWLICGYDSRVLPAQIVDDARRTHPQLAVGETSEPSADYTDPAFYYSSRNTDLGPRPTDGVVRTAIHGDLAPARAFVARHALRLGLAAERVADFVLAVNEVTTNALRHGAGRGDLRMWTAGPRLVCEVTDSGRAPDGFVGFLRGEPTAERGHGLWIARQLCDLLEIRGGDRGTTVRLHIRLAL